MFSLLGATLCSVSNTNGSRGLAEELIPLKTKVSCRSRWVNSPNYLSIFIKFWTEPRYCMILRLKPMGKSTTYQYLSSFGQNQGIVWFSDSNLWGNQLLISIYQVLDRTKVFYGSRTQTYRETNYLSIFIKFWTEPRYCMVLGLKPMGKPTTYLYLSNFGTEPRYCMVLEFRPMGKPTT